MSPTRTTPSIETVLARWHRAVTDAAVELRQLPDRVARRRPAPGKSCVKEIIGHLIDSAAHNHRRFVQAALEPAFVFPGYAQDAWVGAQRYQDAAWPALADLWAAYNSHLMHVARAIPSSALRAPRVPHNVDQIGWQPLAPTEPATLAYLIEDYVGHLEHHLEQVRRILREPPTDD